MTTNLNEVKFMSETEFGKLTNTDDDKLYLVKSPGAQLVETWKSSDGTSWYRKWSDGYIETSLRVKGQTTTTFPIGFKGLPNIFDSRTNTLHVHEAYDLTNTTIKYIGDCVSVNTIFCVLACGY